MLSITVCETLRERERERESAEGISVFFLMGFQSPLILQPPNPTQPLLNERIFGFFFLITHFFKIYSQTGYF